MSKIINNEIAFIEFVDSNGQKTSFPKNRSTMVFDNSVLEIKYDRYSILIKDIAEITAINDEGTPVTVPANLSLLHGIFNIFFFRKLDAGVQTTSDLSDFSDVTPLFLKAQISPTNLSDITVDGNYCVRNAPADLAAQGITGHTNGDILRRLNGAWTFLLTPVAGVTKALFQNDLSSHIFIDDPTVGASPVFQPEFITGEPFSVFALATDLPGTVTFDGTDLVYTQAGGLVTGDINFAIVFINGSIPYWIEDTVNPERSGVYNLVINDTVGGTYTFRRDYRFRSSNNFTDGQSFFIGISGGNVAEKNFLLILEQQFVINTAPLRIILGKISDVAISTTIAIEEFAFSQARFFGELGVPSSNENGNWTEVNPTEIVLLNDTVRGVPKLVVRFRDTNAGIQTAAILAVSAIQWSNLFTFGGEFGGRISPTDISGSFNFFFMGLGVSGANNPTASSANQRFGAFIKKDPLEEFIVVDETEGPLNVVLDGTGGKPFVERGDYMDIFISIDIGFTNPRWIVNGIDIGAAAILDNSNTLDEVTIASGSSSGVGNIFDVDNFGITILEELTTKTISPASMSLDAIKIITPPIKIDFEIILPDGNGRRLGDTFIFSVNNVGGALTIKAFDLNSPQILVNGLKSFVFNVINVEEFIITNTIENGNVYSGNFTGQNADGSVDFGILSSVSDKEGRVYYDIEDKALSLKTDIKGSTQSLGQEFWVRVINKTGVTIADGKAVYINGFDATSGRPTIALAQADLVATSDPIGFATSAMLDGIEGVVTTMGFLNNLDTSSFAAGVQIFLSDTVAGDFTITKPSLVILMGFVTKSDATTGQIFTTISRTTSDSPIFALLSSNVDQEPTVTTPVVITYNTQDGLRGLTHSTTVNPGEITVVIGGTYFIGPQPQVGKDSGGVAEIFDMFLQVDTGSGFVDEPNSTIKLTVRDAGDTDVIVSGIAIVLQVGDKIRMMQRVSTSAVGLGLKFTAAEVGPPTVPATPSIIFTMIRSADLP